MMIKIRDKENLYKVLAIVSGAVDVKNSLGLSTREVQPVFVVVDRHTKETFYVSLAEVEKVDV